MYENCWLKTILHKLYQAKKYFQAELYSFWFHSYLNDIHNFLHCKVPFETKLLYDIFDKNKNMT